MDDQCSPKVEPRKEAGGDRQGQSTNKLSDIQVVFDQSGLNRSSRDEPERRYPCPSLGCKVECKRKYERDRHYQTKHTQSQHWFCPIGRCNCTHGADELAAVLSSKNLMGWISSYPMLRESMKAEEVHGEEEQGYPRYQLFGFPRRDKLMKHIKKAHKDAWPPSDDLLLDRDSLLKEPISAELQVFWYEVGFPFRSALWGSTTLTRIQREDGSWTEWVGYHSEKIAETGFRPWTKSSRECYLRRRQSEKLFEGTPWQAEWEENHPSSQYSQLTDTIFDSTTTSTAQTNFTFVPASLADQGRVISHELECNNLDFDNIDPNLILDSSVDFEFNDLGTLPVWQQPAEVEQNYESEEHPGLRLFRDE